MSLNCCSKLDLAFLLGFIKGHKLICILHEEHVRDLPDTRIFRPSPNPWYRGKMMHKEPSQARHLFSVAHKSLLPCSSCSAMMLLTSCSEIPARRACCPTLWQPKLVGRILRNHQNVPDKYMIKANHKTTGYRITRFLFRL